MKLPSIKGHDDVDCMGEADTPPCFLSRGSFRLFRCLPFCLLLLFIEGLLIFWKEFLNIGEDILKIYTLGDGKIGGGKEWGKKMVAAQGFEPRTLRI
jgi:hypothetical protein